MIEVDAQSLEGAWNLIDGDGPSAGQVTFTAGEVIENGAHAGSYKVEGAVLTVTTAGASYVFELPGPLATPGEPSLFGAELIRVAQLSGVVTSVGNDIEISDSCSLSRA